MFKWLTHTMAPKNSRFRWALLPMPERLLEINAEPALQRDGSEEFSEIVTSLWINDVNKRTGRDRLPCTLRAIADALPRDIGRLRMLDLGASDAVSTYDAVSFFRDQLRIPVTAHALDLYTQLHRFDGTFLREYRTSDGSPVLVRAGRVGLRLGRRLSFRPAELCRVKYLQSVRMRGRLRRSMSIPLVHPLAAADSDITIAEANALQARPEFGRAFDVVRICNLLNHSYFSRPQIETIIGHAVSYLADGGLLVVSRNDDHGAKVVERGTVWRRAAGGLCWISNFNGGSELRRWIEAVGSSPAVATQPLAA